MTFQERQSHLIDQIAQLQDENLLIMLEEELSYHLQSKGEIQLSAPDLDELISIADEPDDDNIVSENEYRKATDKWRMR